MKKRDLHRAEPRHDQMKSHKIREEVHDTYQTRKKFREPSVCRQCDAVYHEGRWQWMEESPQGAFHDLCPACHRINDKYPAGEVTLSGTFLAAHRSEILGLVRNEAEAETSEHPLHRIMEIEERPDDVVVTTTDIHLPRRIGHALEHAYKGHMEIHFDKEGHFARMKWHRDGQSG
jgi:hypothetical protein